MCSQAHNRDSTVRHREDDLELRFDAGTRDTLYKNLSPLRFEMPFFYGNIEDFIFMLMFDRSAGIRFAHSPSGGGGDPARKTTRPAWDFQFIVPKYEVLEEYGFNARAVLRPRCSREEILGEFEKWRPW